MNTRNTGFTLFELIVTLAIILMIFSVVYGTYFTTSDTAQACRNRQLTNMQIQNTIGKISRQLRCIRPGDDINWNHPVNQVIHAEIVRTSRYAPTLKCNLRDRNILIQGISTIGVRTGPYMPVDSIQFYYKHDPKYKILYYAQMPVKPYTQDLIPRLSWLPIAWSVEAVTVTFFDGENWHQQWDSQKQYDLPIRFKLTLIMSDTENNQTEMTTESVFETTLYQINTHETEN